MGETMVRITSATAGHAQDIARVQVRSWQVAYADILDPVYLAGLTVAERETRWLRILAASDSRTLVAHTEAGVVGFVSLGPWREAPDQPDQGEIWALYALPEVWNTGVGRALLAAALEDLAREGRRQVFLWVLRDNTRARRFYQQGGFRLMADSTKSFELGGRLVDEVCMERQVPKPATQAGSDLDGLDGRHGA